MIKHEIFKNEDIIVEYFTREIPSDTLIVVANGAWLRMIEDGLVVMDGKGYYGNELFAQGYDIVAFKNKSFDYYSSLSEIDIINITNKINQLIKGKYTRKVYFGGCASSCLALNLSPYLEFETAVLLMPRNELRPEDCENMGLSVIVPIDASKISAKCNFILCTNFNHAWDYENLKRFSSKIKNKTILNIPDIPEVHDIMQTLKRHKVWKIFIHSIITKNEIIKHKAIMDLELIVRTSVAEQLFLDVDSIKLESSFTNDFDVDSLDLTEISMDLENKLDIKISLNYLKSNLDLVQDLLSLVTRIVAGEDIKLNMESGCGRYGNLLK